MDFSPDGVKLSKYYFILWRAAFTCAIKLQFQIQSELRFIMLAMFYVIGLGDFT